MDHEFKQIFYNDCYGLRRFTRDVNRIVDVGGNLGFFAMAARDSFPHATIQLYEPNPHIQSILRSHLMALDVQVFSEAVGRSDGSVDLEYSEGSLFTKTRDTLSGSLKKISIQKVLSRSKGRIDLLKLDCEGAEWELFEDTEFWESVGSLVMEYHLWAKPNSSICSLIAIIKELGFRITHLNESEKLQWGILHATKT